MRLYLSLCLLLLLLLACCSAPVKQLRSNFYGQVAGLPAIAGNLQYLASPYVTSGSRLYLIGHQDGSFPDLGWHIEGEMGGIWRHPIKLMDGFSAELTVRDSNASYCLNKANRFINYPMANSHHFTWDSEEIAIERFQFVPDEVEGAIVEYRIVNQSSKDKDLVFSFTGMADLRPTWLGERTNMLDAEDEIYFDEGLSAFIAKDKKNPWYAAFGSLLQANEFSEEDINCEPVARKGLGKDGTLAYTLTLKAGEEITIPFFIAGSDQSEEALRATYALLKTDGKAKLAEKISRYKGIDSIAQLRIPDENIEQMYVWLKYNVDWLTLHVPEQGIGLAAGLPDYPWWFGADAVYALQGVLAAGNHELAKNTIQLLHRISQKTNNNGRIIHEVSTNGAVYNPGNVNETAQFITLLLHYYEWTGDKELITRLFPDVRKGVDWLLKERDPDGNLYPNGSGMMEIPGLESETIEMIDVAIYTQQALASAAKLASLLGEQATATAYQKQAEELKARINQEWWSESARSYGDFRGTLAEAKPILDAALVRADTLHKPWAVAELKETAAQLSKYPSGKRIPHVIYHNWVVNTPLETGIADADKGQKALQTAKEYENPFGVYVTGIDRTEEPDSVVLKSRKKTFSYLGAVMTLPTGVQAVAAANYGKPEDALRYLNMLHRSFSYALPGSMYEVSPDFGMVTQAWNIYGVAVPIVRHFFGIQPQAYQQAVYLSPRLPAHWKDVSLEDIKLGDNLLSVSISQQDDYTAYLFRQTHADWRVLLDVANAKAVKVNDQEVDLQILSGPTLELTGQEIRVQLYPSGL